MEERIRAIFRDHAQLIVDMDQVSDDTNLYEAGMTSHASVNVMLALENEFDVEFPDRLLHRAVFATVNSVRDAITELRSEQAV